MSILLKNKVENQLRSLELISKRSGITGFQKMLGDKILNIDGLFDRCVNAYKNKVDLSTKQFSILGGKLSTLSPLAVLERGYSCAMKDGKMINSITEIDDGDEINIRMLDGEAICNVIERRKFDEI